MAMESEARPEEASIHQKMKTHDIQKRLNLLFGPDEKEVTKKEQETVNEEATTDTQIDSEFEMESKIKE
jgi:hypothetical protein